MLINNADFVLMYVMHNSLTKCSLLTKSPVVEFGRPTFEMFNTQEEHDVPRTL